MPLPDIEPVGGSYNNLGNLETASGNLIEANDYFQLAKRIYINGGDATATSLARVHLNFARMYLLSSQLSEAEEAVRLAENIIRRTGAEATLMAPYVLLVTIALLHKIRD